MPPGEKNQDRNKLNRLEELKGRLFSKDYEMRIERHDAFTRHKPKNIPDSWQSAQEGMSNFGEKFFMKTSLFKKLFIFSLSFLLLAMVYGSYMFFAGGNTVSPENIEISVFGNAYTSGGEELSLQLEITNKNSSPLQLVDLVLEYPKSSSANLQDTERIRVSLGTIPAGTVRSENVKLTLFGEQGSTKQIKISLEYRVEGSNAIFVKTKLYDVSINSTPINLSVEAPDSISPNQELTLVIKASLNATKPSPAILVSADYPVGFAFTEASPKPSFGNNVWNLGDLSPGAEKTITIKGRMLDVSDGEEKTFHIFTGSQSSTNKSNLDVVFNSIGHTVAIKKSAVEARLSVNGAYQREYSVDTATPINAEITWANNLETKINDLVITAKISGNAVDKKKIDGGSGFYDSAGGTITWDRNSESRFREVSPGESGSVSFFIPPVSVFGSSGGILVDPLVNIEISISGKQELSGYEVTTLNSSTSSTVRIASDVGFATKALYYSGPFANSGPIPPKAEKKTTYTVVWSLTNTANNISKGTVRSSLPQWVSFAGAFTPSGENFAYNASTRELVWNVGRIPKGTGVSLPSKEISFQIIFAPSLSQVGTVPIIVNEAVLTGHDDFANVDVKATKAPLYTRLSNDPAFPTGGERVVE
ncbi:MAG TPA: hypothetical protein VJB95_00575 [Candidatus Paceibacterota bacterium]